jgi:predicted double-glycine peptidase
MFGHMTDQEVFREMKRVERERAELLDYARVCVKRGVESGVSESELEDMRVNGEALRAENARRNRARDGGGK